MDQAARGASFLKERKYAEAIEQYTAAINISPGAADYYVKRSIAYQRSTPPDFESALRDAEIAVVAAVKRARFELVTQAQLRRAITLFCLDRYADAEFILDIVKQRDPKEKSLAIWDEKIKAKLNALEEGSEQRNVTVSSVPSVEIPVTSKPKADKNVAEVSSTAGKPAQATAGVKSEILQTPPGKIKHEWYQSGDKVYITLLAKGVPKDKAEIDIQERSVSLTYSIAGIPTNNLSGQHILPNRHRSGFRILS
jgi:suppressor of G2 allele of SKP1